MDPWHGNDQKKYWINTHISAEWLVRWCWHPVLNWFWTVSRARSLQLSLLLFHNFFLSYFSVDTLAHTINDIDNYCDKISASI